jgi:hypothetical protein
MFYVVCAASVAAQEAYLLLEVAMRAACVRGRWANERYRAGRRHSRTCPKRAKHSRLTRRRFDFQVREQRDNSANRNSLKSIFINIFLCIYTHRSGALVGDPDLVCARGRKKKNTLARRAESSLRYLNYIGRSAQKVCLLLLLWLAQRQCVIINEKRVHGGEFVLIACAAGQGSIARAQLSL